MSLLASSSDKGLYLVLVLYCYLVPVQCLYQQFMQTCNASLQLLNYYNCHGSSRITITTSVGKPIQHYMQSLTLGPNGPLLTEDLQFFEEFQKFNREKLGERPNAKGTGAFGYFQVTHDVTKFTKADLFSHVGKKTPILCRISLGGINRGTPDTSSFVKGFATKFYTKEGNWDLLANDVPVFRARDTAKFFSFARTQRNPATNTFDPNTSWNNTIQYPESMFRQLLTSSYRSKPLSFRHMDNFAINSFLLVNSEGNFVHCKFHIRSDLGFQTMSRQRSRELAVENPDYFIEDLYNAIGQKNYPSWTLNIQVMTIKQAKEYKHDPFDVTRLWREDEFPLIPVGKIVLNRNPSNQFADIEQAAFSPGNLVPGIEPGPDNILKARMFNYPDSQLQRLGTNFNQLAVNRPYKTVVANIQRDGQGTYTNNGGGAPNYYPSSFDNLVGSARGAEHVYEACGIVRRYNVSGDNFDQARMFYEELLEEHKRDLEQTIARSLRRSLAEIQAGVTNLLMKIHPELSEQVSMLIQAD